MSGAPTEFCKEKTFISGIPLRFTPACVLSSICPASQDILGYAFGWVGSVWLFVFQQTVDDGRGAEAAEGSRHVGNGTDVGGFVLRVFFNDG